MGIGLNSEGKIQIKALSTDSNLIAQMEGGTIAIKGDKGEQGEQGEKGDQGIPGVTPNIEIGEVTTLKPEEEATVENVGSLENPKFNFGIPKGDKGDSCDFFGMEIIDGNLYIITNEKDTEPSFEIDENGELIYIIK